MANAVTTGRDMTMNDNTMTMTSSICALAYTLCRCCSADTHRCRADEVHQMHTGVLQNAGAASRLHTAGLTTHAFGLGLGRWLCWLAGWLAG